MRGKIVVAGLASEPADALVAQYDQTGKIDPTFGDNGVAELRFRGLGSEAAAVVANGVYGLSSSVMRARERPAWTSAALVFAENNLEK